MPWYKITIYPKTGKPKTGARLIDLDNEDKVRAFVWNQAREKLGRWNIDNIEITEIKNSDPYIRAAIEKKFKEQGRKTE